MKWTTRAPSLFGSIAEVLPRFRTEGCRALAEGYASLLVEQNARVPAKNSLDISRFVSAIPHLVLAAITKPDRCIYRLAGEEMKKRIGMNPTGKNYYDFVPKDRFAHASHAMHMVVDVPSAFRADIAQQYSDGRARMIEVFAVPLGSDDPAVDGFILFADCEVSGPMVSLPTDRMLLGANVLARDLIDLGYGVDRSFVDRVVAD
ncbi:MAG: hypothetical protein NXI19_11530 [Alphaproteobacteria bacterium]|nr:hypothetical protein [Alphaproteobacteria bacterium]